MKNKLVYLYIISIIIFISSCTNFGEEVNNLNNGDKNIVAEISFDFEIDDDIERSNTRGISFLPSDNQNGYNHPSISIMMEEGRGKTPLILYIYNDKVPDRNKAGSKDIHKGKVITINNWKYVKEENGKTKISINNYDANLGDIGIYQLKTKGWKMRAVLGGNRKGYKIGFGKGNDNIIAPIIKKGEPSNLDVVYISNTIDIEYQKIGKKHTINRSDKSVTSLKLTNQSLILFYSINENRLNKATTINGIKIKADNLSFKGYFSLRTGEYTSEDDIDDANNTKEFIVREALSLANPMTSRTPYVAIVAVPTKGASTTNLSLTSLITESLIPTKTIEFQNKAIAPNTYYSLGDNLYVENE